MTKKDEKGRRGPQKDTWRNRVGAMAEIGSVALERWAMATDGTAEPEE